jgi:CubicO group peptidase (beta-lactamase class C family)
VRRTLITLALVLLLTIGLAPVAAQVETSVPEPPATPLAPPAATGQPDLTGVAPLPLTGERRAAFEAYVADALDRVGVPGASVAVVQDGQVVYLQGFGVKELGGTEPVTPDTLLMIGSVTKSLTSAMAATLVDEGWLSWETPLVELLPKFAVADPELTPRLTIADAFCACTGIPRRDPEGLFNADTLTPEGAIAQVAELPLTTPFGEMFQYSNQLYTVGGYAAAAAAGAASNDLDRGYVLAMQERLLNPMGMTRSTFALEDVLASGDYALPHNAGIDGQTVRLPLLIERTVGAGAPSGALWSSAREMARYLQTQLADGVAPDGTRVVSAQNLARTRAARVAIPERPGLPPVLLEAAQHYAMGWFVGEWRGLEMINHSGGVAGFAAEAAFLPEAGVGVVILTNDAQDGGIFTNAVEFRLFELLFDQPAEIDALLDQSLEAQATQLAEVQAQLRPVDPTVVAPYLGRYTHPGLGEIELALRGGRLIFDAGEVRSELRAMADEAGQIVAYVFTDPPLAGRPTPVILQRGADGTPEIAITVEGENPEATATYVLTLLVPVAATPVP